MMFQLVKHKLYLLILTVKLRDLAANHEVEKRKAEQNNFHEHIYRKGAGKLRHDCGKVIETEIPGHDR